MVKAAEAQLSLLPIGIDNLVPISDEARKAIYQEARKAPEGTFPIPPSNDNKDKTLHHQVLCRELLLNWKKNKNKENYFRLQSGVSVVLNLKH